MEMEMANIKLFNEFIDTHYYKLLYIYNNIFKEYNDIINIETFVNFAYHNTSKNGRYSFQYRL